MSYSRRHEAAERVALRRWLKEHNFAPCNIGDGPNHLQALMVQVLRAGQDPFWLMAIAREKVDFAIKDEGGAFERDYTIAELREGSEREADDRIARERGMERWLLTIRSSSK